MNNRTALFLDRDGVINTRLPGDYVSSTSAFQFCAGTLEAVSLLSLHFFPILVVTNQAGIGKGLMTTAQLDEIHTYMTSEIAKVGGRIDRIYYCPNKAAEMAACRKPEIGMGLAAKQDFPMIDFTQAWMVGDSHADMEFAQRLGMKTALVEGKQEEMDLLRRTPVQWRGNSLLEFAHFILARNDAR